jgi:hypothetical protein
VDGLDFAIDRSKNGHSFGSTLINIILSWILVMLVKLNDRGVRVYMAGGGAAYRPRPDWQNRTGRIASYSRDRSHAYVVWNGTHSPDRVSVALIEPVSESHEALRH